MTEPYCITVLNEDFTLQGSAPYYNLELFELQCEEALSAYSFTLINALETAESIGVYIIIENPGTTALQGAATDIVLGAADVHDATAKTTQQYIKDQRDIARAAAKDNLYAYRDLAPVAMYAVVIAQRLRTLQGDVDEIETQAQAVAYFTTKMIEHATLVDASSTTEAGTLLRHAFQAMFLTFVEASEYAANGSDD